MADTDIPERFDPNRLIGRWTVAALALAGAALVLLPSVHYGWDPIKGGWAIRPTLWIANLAALIGCGLALAIGWSAQAHRAAPLLGAGFGAAAIAWGLQSADTVQFADGSAATWLRIARLDAWLFGAAMFSAFCTRFPRTVTRADYLAMGQRRDAGQVGSGLPASEDPFTMMDAPFSAWDRWVERRLGSTLQHKLLQLARRWGEIPTGAAGEPAWSRRFDKAIEHWMFRDAWLVVLALIPVVAILAYLLPPKHSSLPFTLAGTLGIVSCFAMRFTIISAALDDRRRVLWIAAGIVAAFAAFQLGFWTFILGGLTGHMQIGLGTFILSAPIAALLVVLGFAIAIFGGGALDPGLAIKRSLITGIVATLLTFTFALVEAFVATYFAEQLGLPTAAAPAVASAAVAVALGPMWHRTSSWLNKRLGVAPSSAIASAEPAA